MTGDINECDRSGTVKKRREDAGNVCRWVTSCFHLYLAGGAARKLTRSSEPGRARPLRRRRLHGMDTVLCCHLLFRQEIAQS